jgi:hypothetical protein
MTNNSGSDYGKPSYNKNDLDTKVDTKLFDNKTKSRSDAHEETHDNIDEDDEPQ